MPPGRSCVRWLLASAGRSVSGAGLGRFREIGRILALGDDTCPNPHGTVTQVVQLQPAYEVARVFSGSSVAGVP